MSQLKYKHTKFGYDMNKRVVLLYDDTTIIEEVAAGMSRRAVPS
jgi:hypothetical protein